ncbi:MAG TPA: ABC transporter substrate-binding protein, partial [Thermoanaerobaculia bacterium]|nr:ABC transporter substrate-binding protein [Thermoanaerobaculia bacterium]
LRREDYWSKKPYIPNVILKVVVDDSTAWNAVQRGDVDETIITSDMWAKASPRPDLQRKLEFRRFYTLTYNFVAWNNRDPILSDRRVRRALAKCIDLKSLINNLYHGTARAMTGPFTPDQFAYNPSVPAIGYDPDGARADLNALGWLDTDGDGILNDKQKRPLKFDMLVFGGSGAAVPFAQIYQAELKRIGVQLNIVQLDPSTVFQRLLSGNFQSCYLSFDLDPDPDVFAIFHSSAIPPHGQNFARYSNPEVDKLIDLGRTTLDRPKRIKIYQQLHELIADDQPCTWTLQVSVKWAINRRVRNVKESKGKGLFLWYPGELDWWLAKDRTREGDQKRR